MSLLIQATAVVCLAWSIFIFCVESLGIAAIFRYFSHDPPPSVSSKLRDNVPRVTIIRPVKGLEPNLYQCLAASFQHDYPSERLSIRLCVDDANDPAYPTLQKVIQDFPSFDAKVLVGTDDEYLQGSRDIGPNPKIRNISRAYREATGDLIWIIDCNVWVATGVLGRMVDKVMGFTNGNRPARPYKFVHQLPLVIDLADYGRTRTTERNSFLSSPAPHSSAASEQVLKPTKDVVSHIQAQGGGRLDEMFMATTHAKFYGAINAVGVAPCIVGKSNMFRKSHLEQVTDPARNPIISAEKARPTGVDYFSSNICEDHLIGDLLWRSNLPGHLNHGILWGDLVIQPMADMSVVAFMARRVRWLRARKITVLLATLVEPGVESFLCCAYFAFSVTTLPWFEDCWGIPPTWTAMGLVWLFCVGCWMIADWFTYRRLHSGRSVHVDENTPAFARGSTVTTFEAGPDRAFWAWVFAWLGRETLALPIWIRAVLLGMTVTWRGKSFRVRPDASVVEITKPSKAGDMDRPATREPHARSKRRVD